MYSVGTRGDKEKKMNGKLSAIFATVPLGSVLPEGLVLVQERDVSAPRLPSNRQPPAHTTDATNGLFLFIYLRYHILVILVFRIFLCSWKMPYMRASLVGGQPGT